MPTHPISQTVRRIRHVSDVSEQNFEIIEGHIRIFSGCTTYHMTLTARHARSHQIISDSSKRNIELLGWKVSRGHVCLNKAGLGVTNATSIPTWKSLEWHGDITANAFHLILWKEVIMSLLFLLHKSICFMSPPDQERNTKTG